MENSIFDIIAEYSVNERLDKTLLQKEEYLKVQNKISERTKQVDELNLTKEQRLMIDRLICAHTESGTVYGKMAYKLGVQDCAALLREIKLLKAS